MSSPSLQSVPVRTRAGGGAALLLCLILAVAVYSPGLTAEYAYDGRALLDSLRPLTPGALGAALVTPAQFGPATGILSWRPLQAADAFFLDVLLFRATPLLSHALDLLLHGFCAWLLLRLLLRLLPATAPARPDGAPCPASATAWAGTLFFLLHPLNSEAVLCMGFRADLVSAACILGVLLLVLPPGGAPLSPLRLATAAGVFGIGLLHKEITGAVLPAAPLVIWLAGAGDGAQRRRAAGRAALGLGVVFAAYFGLWLLFRFPAQPGVRLGGGGPGLGAVNALIAVKEIFLPRLVWPWPLRIDHAFEAVTSYADPRVFTALAVLLPVAGAVGWWSWRNRLAAAATGFILAAFLPYAQIVPIPEAVAERFAYVPMLGAGMLVAAAWAEGCRRFTPDMRRLAAVAVLVAAIAAAGVCLRRSLDWRTDLGLNLANWEETGDARPLARRHLGALHLIAAQQRLAKGDTAGARTELAAAAKFLALLLDAAPGDAEGWRLLALTRQTAGDRDGALAAIRRALELAPADPAVQATAATLRAYP